MQQVSLFVLDTAFAKPTEDIDQHLPDPGPSAPLLLSTLVFLQMLAEAQQMQNDVLELRVQTSIIGNDIARLDNPILRAKLQSLSITADRILANTEE